MNEPFSKTAIHSRMLLIVMAIVLAATLRWPTGVSADDDAMPDAATSPRLQYPLAVAVREIMAETAASDVATAEAAIEVFIADRKLPGIWRLTGQDLTVFFQGSKTFRTPLNAVRCVACDGKGRLFAGDSATREIYRIEKGQAPVPLTGGRIGIPMDVAVSSDGQVYVSDLETHRIWRLPAEGGAPEEFAAIAAPRGISFDSKGRLLVVSHGADQVVRLTTDGTSEVVVAGRPFQFPHQIIGTPDGTLFVTDGYAKAIWKVAPGMPPAKLVSGPPLTQPVGLAIHQDTLFVADPHARSVFRVDFDGKIAALSPSGTQDQ